MPKHPELPPDRRRGRHQRLHCRLLPADRAVFPGAIVLGTGRLEPVRRHRRGAAWRLPHRRPPAKPRPGHRATRSSQADTRTWRSTRHADLATPADSTRYCRSRHSSARPGDPVEGSGERCLYGVAPLGSVTGVSGTAAGRPSPIWQELPGAVGCLGEVWGSLSRQYWSSKRRSTRPVGPKRCRTTRSSAARLSSCAHGRTGPRMCRSPMRSATWDSCPVLREVGQLWGLIATFLGPAAELGTAITARSSSTT